MPEVKTKPLADAAAELYAQKHEAAEAARKKMAADVATAIKSGVLDDRRMGAAPYIADG